MISTFIASFCGIAIVAALHYHAAAISGFGAPPYTWQWMIGSFGATAVLLYATPESPLAQPRCLLGGHVGSALIGASINLLLPGESTRWLACALAVSLSITFMQAARVVHPPGGATALIAVSIESARNQGYFFVVFPVFVGACVMLLVALIVNNVVLRFPLYWWAPDEAPAVAAPPVIASLELQKPPQNIVLVDTGSV